MIIVVPCCESGRGGGHLSRCVSLVKDLRAIGKEAYLYLQEKNKNILNLLKSRNFNMDWLTSSEELEVRSENSKKDIDLIITDNFQTTHKEIVQWKKIAPVIGIDEGGSYRDRFDFLIDMLIPENFIKPAANIYSPELLIKDLTRRHRGTEDTENRKILISFGQEDTAGLGLKTARILSKMKNNQSWDITLLKGNLNTPHSSLLTEPKAQPHSVKVIEAIPNLAEHLHEYDLVITHYGLTAYEALFAGTQVLLDHPTPYHKKIAKAAGFKTFTKKRFTQRHRLQTGGLKEDLHFDVNMGDSLAALVNSFRLIVNRSCPICGEEAAEYSTARFNDRTYRRCSKCGIIYMDRINEPPVEYEKEYFFESYVKQYGKTYLDDFENIKQNGINRLRIIKSLRVSVPPCELLDIGCAYGPFLAAAKEEGFSPAGIDPAEDAVKYVNEKLGIPAIHTLFPTPNSSLLIPHSFDVITLWYVIEHFKDCISVFNEIKKLLKPNGILAFSTPSFSGISGRKNLRAFLSASPADHFTVWSPKMCKKALSLAGLKVKKIVIAGHHPERFPVLGKFAKSRKGFIYKVLMAVSKLFELGDTFEVYAKYCNGKRIFTEPQPSLSQTGKGSPFN